MKNSFGSFVWPSNFSNVVWYLLLLVAPEEPTVCWRFNSTLTQRRLTNDAVPLSETIQDIQFDKLLDVKEAGQRTTDHLVIELAITKSGQSLRGHRTNQFEPEEKSENEDANIDA